MQTIAERDALLREVSLMGASDLILTPGSPPLAIVAGLMRPVPGAGELRDADLNAFVEHSLNSKHRERLHERGEVDSRLNLEGVANFRVNTFRQQGRIAAAIRVVPLRIPLPSEIGLGPSVVQRLLGFAQGLILITGPTGAGKSTTIASLLEQVNQGGVMRHIVTIEDPIEFVFQWRNGVFHQREVGSDTRTYTSGLKAALREMPHIIFLGEMRDLESAAIGLTAAETGNLVISTMATQSTAQTVSRIIDLFPPERQSQVRSQLSMTLRAVVSQFLIRRADGTHRVASREVMFVNSAISNLIREDKVFQIPNIVSTAGREGMKMMDDSLLELYETGIITAEAALARMVDPEKQKRIFDKLQKSGQALEARA